MTSEREIYKDPTLLRTRFYDKINPQLLPKVDKSKVLNPVHRAPVAQLDRAEDF